MSSGVEGWDQAGRPQRGQPGYRQPLEPHLQQVMETLDWLGDRMQDAADALAEADLDWTQKKIKYELAYARSVLEATGRNKEQREAWATVQTGDLYRDVEMAASVERTCRAATYTLQNRMKAYQSVSAILRGATN